jgi:aminopeptidase N
MVQAYRGLVVACALPFMFFLAQRPTAPAMATNASISVLRHDLFVEIDPERHVLRATDRLTIELTQPRAIQFMLASTLQLDRLVLVFSGGSPEQSGRDVPFEIVRQNAPGSGQRVTVPADFLTTGTMTMTASYHGTINDPPKEPRHLRFVTPSETAGHIGSEGVYLSSETQWYLDAGESLAEYRLRVALPAGWIAVSQGKVRRSGACPLDLCSEPDLTLAEWEPIPPSEALTLAANRFVAKTRDWLSQGGQAVQLGAYLFPEDAQLADEYLDATARYLEAYIGLLGPYPFATFSVVENFFASGLGMPSFSLLGSGVIKRHYVQPYALGHEIVHSWIGNSVLNRTERGNWVEGLTTYLANYYWHEWAGEDDQARDQRRLMLRGYNLYVPAERDYPVRQFTQKHDERDNAIGYQKAAMVFHLLRHEIGDEAFWRSLKRLVAMYRGRPADWRDVEQVFVETSGKDLRWFFAQWVEQSGAPDVSVKEVSARPLSNGEFRLEGRILQSGAAFQSPLPFRIVMADERQETMQTRIGDRDDRFTAVLPARPLSLEIDPDATVLRRIRRQDLPPVLNHYVTDPRRSVVSAFIEPNGAGHPFDEVVKRIKAQENQKPASQRAAVVPLHPGRLLPPEGSVLVLGTPSAVDALQPVVNEHCGPRVQLRKGGVTIDGTAHDGPAVAILVNCHRSDQPGSVVSWLYAVSPQAATSVARLLFFYGWNTVIVFRDGKAVARAEWEPRQARMEVLIDETVPDR